MKYKKGKALTKGEVIAAIDTDTILYVEYTEPDPGDAHHGMKGVGRLRRNEGVELANVKDATPKVQDIFAFEDMPILTVGDDLKDEYAAMPAEFIDEMGNRFAFFKATPIMSKLVKTIKTVFKKHRKGKTLEEIVDDATTLHCPDCGKRTLRLIENTEPDGGGEYKEVRTCDHCENMVHVFRETPHEQAKKLRQFSNDDILGALYTTNKPQPNGGPRLLIATPTEDRPFFAVGDGSHHYGDFTSEAATIKALRKAGFKSHKGAGLIYWHTS